MVMHCDNQEVMYIVNNLFFLRGRRILKWTVTLSKLVNLFIMASCQLGYIITKLHLERVFILCKELGTIDIYALA